MRFAISTFLLLVSMLAGVAFAGDAPEGGDTSTQVKSLEQKMMSDQEVMNRIQSLQNDPEFQKILQDPEIMKAVNSNDVAALMANPQFMKLLQHPTVQEIEKKVAN